MWAYINSLYARVSAIKAKWASVTADIDLEMFVLIL